MSIIRAREGAGKEAEGHRVRPGWCKQSRREEKEKFCISSFMMCPPPAPGTASLRSPSAHVLRAGWWRLASTVSLLFSAHQMCPAHPRFPFPSEMLTQEWVLVSDCRVRIPAPLFISYVTLGTLLSQASVVHLCNGDDNSTYLHKTHNLQVRKKWRHRES